MTKPLHLNDANWQWSAAHQPNLARALETLFMRCMANALTADPSDADVRETIATIFFYHQNRG
jgi:hypothetical protein